MSLLRRHHLCLCGWLLRPWVSLPIILAAVVSPILINMARASPPPSPLFVSVVIFLFVCCYHHLPPPSPLHCLIVVLLSSWSSIIRRPSSAVHHHVISPSATSPSQYRPHCRLKRLIVVYIDSWQRRSSSSPSAATAALLSSSSSSLCPSLSLSRHHCSSPPLPPPPLLPPLTLRCDMGRRGAWAGVQSQQDWAMGRVNIKERWKKGKVSWHRVSCVAQSLGVASCMH